MGHACVPLVPATAGYVKSAARGALTLDPGSGFGYDTDLFAM